MYNHSIIVVCKYHYEKSLIMEGTTNVTKKILEDPLTDVIGIDDKEFPIKEMSSALYFEPPTEISITDHEKQLKYNTFESRLL